MSRLPSYHQLMALQKPAPAAPAVAQIYAISNGAARLYFADGTTSQKYYRLNPAVTFAAGQRVRLEAVCGTYVVTARIS